MSDKVKLPREVAEAIESLRSRENGFSDYSIIGMMHNQSNYHPKEIGILNSHMTQDRMHPDDLIKAMVNGYEIELSPEEQVREYFEDQRNKEFEYKNESDDAIKLVLDLLNIKIPGVTHDIINKSNAHKLQRASRSYNDRF